MKRHIQICEKNRLGSHKKIDIGSELGAKMFFPEDYLRSLTEEEPSSMKFQMNVSFGIYESDYLSLFK